MDRLNYTYYIVRAVWGVPIDKKEEWIQLRRAVRLLTRRAVCPHNLLHLPFLPQPQKHIPQLPPYK